MASSSALNHATRLCLRSIRMTYYSPEKLTKTYGRLDGLVVFITGATSGIGEAAARLFAAEGAKVVCAARRRDKLDLLVGAIEEEGGVAVAAPCDVTDEASVAAAVDVALDRYGRLDGAFNNAGQGGARGALDKISTNDFDRVVAVNLRGVFLCMKYEIAAMLREARGGAIVNTSSIGGLIGNGGNGAYAATKWGLAGLTKSAALDYARHRIRVNAIAPGATRSEMFDRWIDTEEARERMAAAFPMNGIAHPDDMARAALLLLSEETRWTTGVVLPCDAGMSAGWKVM